MKRNWLIAFVLLLAIAAGSFVLIRRQSAPGLAADGRCPDSFTALHSQSYAEGGADPAAEPNTKIDSSEVAYLAGLSDPAQYEAFLDGVSAINNPVHPGRARLQEQISKESLEQTFDHLADNDNLRMLIPAMESVPFAPGCYAADVRIVSRMTRVRKMLADARGNPAQSSLVLKELLSSSAARFPQAYADFRRVLSEAPGNKLTLSELPDMQKIRLQCAAAVYVLGEIEAFDALPLMADLSAQGTPNIDNQNFAGSCPVNPAFLLHAMHRIIRSLPERSLSPEASAARSALLSAAKDSGITEGQTTVVPAWNARYDENDFRKGIPGQAFRYPRNQPEMTLTVYPGLGNLDGLKVQELLAKARDFVSKSQAITSLENIGTVR